MAELKRTFYDSGELRSECFEINGNKNGICKIYYKEGILKIQCNFIDNKLNGEFLRYNKDNIIKEICYYTNNVLCGSYLIYYEINDMIATKCNYKNNNLCGEYISYDINGNIKYSYNFDDIDINEDFAKKVIKEYQIFQDEIKDDMQYNCVIYDYKLKLMHNYFSDINFLLNSKPFNVANGQ